MYIYVYVRIRHKTYSPLICFCIRAAPTFTISAGVQPGAGRRLRARLWSETLYRLQTPDMADCEDSGQWPRGHRAGVRTPAPADNQRNVKNVNNCIFLKMSF